MRTTHSHSHHHDWQKINQRFVYRDPGRMVQRIGQSQERQFGSESPKVNLRNAKVYIGVLEKKTTNKDIVNAFKKYLQEKKDGGINQKEFQGFVRAWESIIKLLKQKVSATSIANSELFKKISASLQSKKFPTQKEFDQLKKKLLLKIKARKSLRAQISVPKPAPETKASKLSELRFSRKHVLDTIQTLKQQLKGADPSDTITQSQKRLLAVKIKELARIDKKIQALSPQKKKKTAPQIAKKPKPAPQRTLKPKERAKTTAQGPLDRLRQLMEQRGVNINSYRSVKKFLNSLGRTRVRAIQTLLMNEGHDLSYSYRYKGQRKTHRGNDGYAGKKTYNALIAYYKKKKAPKSVPKAAPQQAPEPQNDQAQTAPSNHPLGNLKQQLENAGVRLSSYRSVRNFLKKLGRNRVRDIQRKLDGAGHDLSYSYRYKGHKRTSKGIDGIPGRKTYKALIAEFKKIQMTASVPAPQKRTQNKVAIATQRVAQKEVARRKAAKKAIETRVAQEQAKKKAAETRLNNAALNPDNTFKYLDSETQKRKTTVPELHMNYGEHGKWNRRPVQNLGEWLKAYKDINNYREIAGHLQNPLLKQAINHVKFATYIFKNRKQEINFHTFDRDLFGRARLKTEVAGYSVSGSLSKQYTQLHKIRSQILKPKALGGKLTKEAQAKLAKVEQAIVRVYKGLQALESIFKLVPKMKVQQRRALNELDHWKRYTRGLHALPRPSIADPVQTEHAGIMQGLPVQIFPTKSVVQALKKKGIAFPDQAIELFAKLYGIQNIKPYVAYQKEIRVNGRLDKVPRLVVTHLPTKFLDRVKSLLAEQNKHRNNPKKLKEAQYKARLELLARNEAAIIQLHKVFNFNDLGPEGIKYRGGLPTFKKTGRPITMEEIQSGRINAPSKTMLGNFLSGRAAFLRMRDRLKPNKPGFAERMRTEFNMMMRKGILYAVISSNVAKGKSPAKYINAAMAKMRLTKIGQPLTKEQIMMIRRGFLVNEGKLKIEQELNARPVPPRGPIARQIASLAILRLRARGIKVGPKAQDRMLKAINQKVSAGFGVHVDTTNGGGIAAGGGINVDLGNGWSVNMGLSVSNHGLLPGAGVSKQFKLGRGVTLGIHLAGHGITGTAGANLSIPLEGLIPMNIDVSGSVSTSGTVTATIGGSYNQSAHERMAKKEKAKKFKKLDSIINKSSYQERLAIINRDARFRKLMANPKISDKQKRKFVNNAFKLTLIHARDTRAQISNIETIRDMKIPRVVSGGVGVVFIPGTPIPIPFIYIGIKIGDKFVMASCEDRPLRPEQKQQLLAHARKEQNVMNIVYLNSTGAALSPNHFSYDKNGQLRGVVENNNNPRIESMVAQISQAQTIDQYNNQFNRAQVSLRETNKKNIYGLNIDNSKHARVKIKIAPELKGKVHLMYSQNGFNGVDTKIAFRRGTRFAITRFNMYYPRKKEGAHKHVTIYIKPNIHWPERLMDTSTHGQLARNPNHTFTYTGNAQENVHRASSYNEGRLEQRKTIDTKAYQTTDNALVQAIAHGINTNDTGIHTHRADKLRSFADAIFKHTHARQLTSFQYFRVKGSGNPDIGRLMDQIRVLSRDKRFKHLLGGRSLRNNEINLIMMRFVHLSFRRLQRPGRSKKEVMRIFNRTMERFAYPLLRNIFNKHFGEIFDSQEAAMLKRKGWGRKKIIETMILLIKNQFKNLDFKKSIHQAVRAAEMFTSMVGTRGKAGLIVGLRTLAGFSSRNSLDKKGKAYLLNAKEYSVSANNPARRALARLILVTSSRFDISKTAAQETAAERAKTLNSPLALKLARYANFVMGPTKARQLAAMIKKPHTATNNAIYREFRQMMVKVRKAQLSGQRFIDFFTSAPLENGVIRIVADTVTTKVGIYKRCGNLSFTAHERFSMVLYLPGTYKGNSAAARGFDTLRTKGGRMIQTLFGGVSVKIGTPEQPKPKQRVEGGGKTKAKNPTEGTKKPGEQGRRANPNDPETTKGGTINGKRPKAPPPRETGNQSSNGKSGVQVLQQDPNAPRTIAKPVKNLVIDMRNAKVVGSGSNGGSGKKGNVGSRF